MIRFGLALFWVLCALVARADLHYYVEPDFFRGVFRVAVRIDTPKPVERFSIPAWCPGFYFIQNYQNGIVNVAAFAGEETLAVHRAALRTWSVAMPEDVPELVITYEVLANDPPPGFFGVSLHPNVGFINGPAAFVYFDGRMHQAHRLTVNVPEPWQVATGMPRAESGQFVSEDYDEFIDHPLHMGNYRQTTFRAGDRPFEVVFASLDGTYRPDLVAETDRIRRISETTLRFFGNAPFDRYVYLIRLNPGNFPGGLEHRASTVINGWNRNPLGLDSLVAHEFVHTWNVKRIRPRVLGPFDYSQPARTRNLWFAEGVTDYYAHRVLLWSELVTPEQFLATIRQQIDTLQRSRTRLQKTVEEASWECWEHGGFTVGDLSYYNKGFLIGLLFDAAIRQATRGERSLDDVMWLLDRETSPPRPGYDEDDLRLAINRVAGRDLTPLYTRMVRSTEELPYDILRAVGLRFVDQGGVYRLPAFALDDRTVTRTGDGLQRGDRLLEDLDWPRLKREPMEVRVLREGREVAVEVSIAERRANRRFVDLDPFASREAIALREAYLRRSTPTTRSLPVVDGD